MGKVVTSQGLTEFVQEGKVTHVTDHKSPDPNAAAPLAMKADLPNTVNLGESPKPEAKADEGAKTPETSAESDADGVEDSDPESFARRMRAKNAKLREAQEAAAEADRIAETQFNERQLYERRARDLEARLKELEDKPAPKTPEPERKEPKIEDYASSDGKTIDWVKFQKDTAKYAAEEAVRDERKRQSDERAEAEKQAAIVRSKASADQAREVYKDFDKVMGSISAEADQVPQFMLNYLMESEHSGAVAYHLAKDDAKESLRIAKLSPIRGIAELGKLEDRVAKDFAPPKAETPTPAPPQRGGAPAPITPLNGDGTSGITTDPAKMTYKQLREYERARRKKN